MKKALQDYNRAIALDIENANAYYGKGNLHYNLLIVIEILFSLSLIIENNQVKILAIQVKN